MKCIVYQRPDGGVSVVSPAPEFLGRKDEDGNPIFPTEDVGIAAVMAKDIPTDATDVSICDTSEIPSDREFRNAWVRSGRGAAVDITKAREVQRERIETARRLAARDILEREALGEDVAAEKAALANIRAADIVGTVQSVAALKAAWPAGLKRPQ